MSNPQYPPPGGFPPPDNSYPYNSYPPPGGYSNPGGYPPPPPQPGYPPPGGYSNPGGYNNSAENYPPPGSYPQQPYGYAQPQLYANPYSYSGPAKANFGARLVAIIIDGIIAGIGWGILQNFLPNFFVATIGWTITYAIYAVLTSLYFDGATIGKMLLGLKVVDSQGNAPEIGPLILRYGPGYFISWLIMGIGFLIAAFDARGQALHDKIAKTYVISSRPPNNRRTF